MIVAFVHQQECKGHILRRGGTCSPAVAIVRSLQHMPRRLDPAGAKLQSLLQAGQQAVT